MTASDSRPQLFLVAGKDPADEPSGGHSSYVRAHGLAAVAAGYDPIVLCVAETSGCYDAPFGTVHRVQTRWRPLRQLAIAVHEPALRDALIDLATADGPVLAHGFGVWGAAAVSATARLREHDMAAAAALSSYTVYRVEHDSLVRGSSGESIVEQARYRIQAAWAGAVVSRWERRAYRGADRVWANYDSVRDLIHQEHGADIRVDLVSYGPESAFEPMSNPAPATDPWPPRTDRQVRLVCASRHHSRKGVDVLIDALAQLVARGVPVTARLLGRGPLLDAHRARVAELGLTGVVEVTGCVDSVDPYLRGADLYVLSSREEQSGSLALLEALRLGLPVIASAIDGIPEDITDDRTGVLVAPDQVGALADAIEGLAGDPQRRQRIGRAGQEHFEQRFGADVFVASLSAAYDDLLRVAESPGALRAPESAGERD